MLMGYGQGLNLPYDVPANEFLNLESRKFSTSQNWAAWVPDYLEKYDPDPLRYVLSINMPESSDSDFSWAEFVRRNNDELVATYGNLVNRVLSFTYRNFEGVIPTPGELNEADEAILSFTYRNFEGVIPTPGELNEADEAILQTSQRITQRVGESLALCHFRAAITQAFSLAQEANRYLDSKAPWLAIKNDRQDAATTLFVAIQVINCLKTILYPFLPFSSQSVHEFLGFEGPVSDESWDFGPIVSAVKAGNPLNRPSPLYTKLDAAVVEEETQRLGGQVA
jgi:methionyl-tRNA synthetase